MRKTFIYVISLIFTVSGCASYQKHPTFIEKHKKIYTASVMPPDVEIYKLNFKGDKDPMYDLMAKATDFSKDEIEKIFSKKNYDVQKLDLGDDVLAENPELKTALFNVKSLFNQKLGEINKRKQKQFTYSLGSDVNQFADIANADVLVFIKETGYKKTGGEIAKDVAKSVLISAAFAVFGGIAYVPISPSVATIQIAVVDSNTGDILWYNYNRDNPGIDLGNEKSARGILQTLFNSFPKRIAEEKQIKHINLPAREQAPQQVISKKAIPKQAVSEALDSAEKKEVEEVVVSEPIVKIEETVEAQEEVKPQAIQEQPVQEQPVLETLPAPVESYKNVIIERIKTQLPANFTPLNKPVWLHLAVLKSGAVKELGILKDKSNSDKEIQRVALKSVDKALPLPKFPEEVSEDELALDIPIQ